MAGEKNAMRRSGRAEEIATFRGMSFEALTAFFAFEVSLREEQHEVRKRFVVTTELIGAPEDRHQRLLSSILTDRRRVLQLLMLILRGEGADVSAFVQAARPGGAAGDGSFGGWDRATLLEVLLQALSRNPARIDQLATLISDLERTPEGKNLLPEGSGQDMATRVGCAEDAQIMSRRRAGQRPDPDAVLDGLKGFQRDTVEYAFERLYQAPDSTRRFLVADEVGLGKTLVARGVIAKAIDHLWDGPNRVEQIDVVYICSNAQIARQNVRRLQISGGRFVRAARLGLLPQEIQGLKANRVNYIALTPGTSFDLRRQHGEARGTGPPLSPLAARVAGSGRGSQEPSARGTCGRRGISAGS